MIQWNVVIRFWICPLNEQTQITLTSSNLRLPLYINHLCLFFFFNCLNEKCAFIKISSLSLWQKPVLVACAKDEDPSISLPKPAVDAAEVRKISSARARLFRRTSQGNVFLAKMVPPDQSKYLISYILKPIMKLSLVTLIIVLKNFQVLSE